MSTDTIAIIAMAAYGCINTGGTVWVVLKIADRVRVVNPVKQQPVTAVEQAVPVANLDERRVANG